jgi:hypothetical protein
MTLSLESSSRVEVGGTGEDQDTLCKETDCRTEIETQNLLNMTGVVTTE